MKYADIKDFARMASDEYLSLMVKDKIDRWVYPPYHLNFDEAFSVEDQKEFYYSVGKIDIKLKNLYTELLSDIKLSKFFAFDPEENKYLRIRLTKKLERKEEVINKAANFYYPRIKTR